MTKKWMCEKIYKDFIKSTEQHIEQFEILN